MKVKCVLIITKKYKNIKIYKKVAEKTKQYELWEHYYYIK